MKKRSVSFCACAGEILGEDAKGADKVQVWARELELPSAGGTMPGLAVAAVNFANTTRTVTIPLSMVASGWCETPLFGNAFISLWGKR